MAKKYNKEGVIGSLIFHGLVLLLLIFFGLKALPHEEEGILVNLGNVQTGQGNIEPPKATPKPKPPVVQKTPPPKTTPAESSKSDDAVKTQDFDEAPVVKTSAQIKKEKEEKEKRDKESAALKKKQEEELQKRLEEDRIAKEIALAEAKAKEEQRIKEEQERKRIEAEQKIKDEARNNVGNAFGKSNSNSTSEGDAGGSGNQGYVTGDPNSKNREGSGLGNSGTGFSLAGRTPDGTLPNPAYGIQEEGVIVIAITVDKYGNVVSAEYQLKGSTSQNATLKAAAIKAAQSAKFNDDKNASAFQKGTITYQFELK